jgi:adenine-specific DNA methylase
MLALLSHEGRQVLRHLEHLPGIHSFSDLASVDVGIVTGANKFFLVSDDVVRNYDLQDYARPMFGRSEHVPGVVYDQSVHDENQRAGMPTNFIWFGKREKIDLAPATRAYVEMGESENLHKRFKCRIRHPWYNVPSVYTTPIAMLKRSHEFPRLVLNSLGALTTDTAYRVITRRDLVPAHLVCAFVTSLTALTAELEGRHYGGGVLELVPSEIERLLIALPSVPKVSLSELDGLFRSGARWHAILERQDRQILESVGVTRDESRILRESWLQLRSRRHRVFTQEGLSGHPTTIENGSVAAPAGA